MITTVVINEFYKYLSLTTVVINEFTNTCLWGATTAGTGMIPYLTNNQLGAYKKKEINHILSCQSIKHCFIFEKNIGFNL